MFHVWCSGEGSRCLGSLFCHPGRQVEGQLGLQQQVGSWGFRAEPLEADTESSTPPGQNSSPGTSPAGRRRQQLGAVSALEQVKNNVGWVSGSCCLYGLSLATCQLSAGAALGSPSSVTNGFLLQCFLDPGQLPLISPLSSPVPY